MSERVAKVVQEYAKRRLQVGDRFEVEPNHVKLLLAIGRIEPVEGEPGYVTADIEPDVASEYQTRDLTARVKRPYTRKAS